MYDVAAGLVLVVVVVVVVEEMTHSSLFDDLSDRCLNMFDMDAVAAVDDGDEDGDDDYDDYVCLAQCSCSYSIGRYCLA